jgi:Rod binding domain-containing protein
MLRTAHDSTEGSLSGESDPTADTTWDIAAQKFSQLLADRGGLGLARMILKNLGDQPRSSTPAL